MSAKSNKQIRVERLRSIDESRLSALAVEFTQTQAKLIERQQHVAKIQSAIKSNPLTNNGHNVAAHLQSLAWLSSLETQLVSATAALKQSESACDEIREQMIAQKVKVNGWEKLSEQLKSEADAKEEAANSMEADDRFLSQSAPR
jgi:flagellar biosynthesis chaperone FliJ